VSSSALDLQVLLDVTEPLCVGRLARAAGEARSYRDALP
jgi:hypothetical protein